MSAAIDFDYKNPDYIKVFDDRKSRIERIRERAKTDKTLMPHLFRYYRDNPIQFIIDWGMTSDPRNADRDLPTSIPFLLFPRQIECAQFVLDRWKGREHGVMDKSREMGATWVMVALAVTLCLFHDGIRIGFGSRKSDYVDKLGDPDSILEKAREFIQGLPVEFRRGWDPRLNGAFMKLTFPGSNSLISGESGNNLGRGGRKTIFFVDEAAWLAQPILVEASLSQTTNCRIDISTPRGMNNPFAKKVHDKVIPHFSMHWRDDPRKDQIWYDHQVKMLGDPVIVAQELDLDYSASIEGVVIPREWVMSAIDAHIKLKIEPSGKRRGALDVADEGRDKNAICGGYGILVNYLKEFSGKNSDIYETTKVAIQVCDEEDLENMTYDADGLGAGVRGDSRAINLKRNKEGLWEVPFIPFHGSGDILDPEKEVFPENAGEPRKGIRSRKNKDYYENFKAQAWFHLRRKFMVTHRAVTEGGEYDPADIISLSSKLPPKLLSQAVTELSQATAKWGDDGKVVINKKPNGTASPNIADSIVIWSAPSKVRVNFYDINN